MMRFSNGTRTAFAVSTALATGVVLAGAAQAQPYPSPAAFPSRSTLNLGQIAAGPSAGQYAPFPLDSNSIPEVDCVTCATGSGGGGTVTQGGAGSLGNAWYEQLAIGGALVSASNKLPVSDTSLDALISAGALPISAASLPLPAGAATSALQSAGNTSLASILSALGSPLQAGGAVTVSGTAAVSIGSSGSVAVLSLPAVVLATGANVIGSLAAGTNNIGKIDIEGNSGATLDVAVAGAGASTNALMVAGLYSSSKHTLTAGNGAAIWLDSRQLSRTNIEGLEPTYSVSGSLTPAANPTDFALDCGSSTTIVHVKSVHVEGSATTAGSMTLQLIARSAADTGGTSTSGTIGLYDTVDPAVTATLLQYSANPTISSTRYIIDTHLLSFGLTASVAGYTKNFAQNGSEGFILRGTTQCLALNLAGGAVPSGGTLTYGIEQVESPE